jgi:SulP family sulfate permease
MPDHQQILSTLGGADRLTILGRVFPDSPSAIRHARTLVTTRRSAP